MSSRHYGGSYKWTILAIASVIAGISTYAQLEVAARAYLLFPALKLNMMQFSAIMSAPMLSAILISILSGALADRYGIKIVTNVGLVIGLIGTTFRFMTHDFWSYFILMFMSGFAVAIINANIAKLVGNWFRPQQHGTALGIYYFACRIGMFLGLATGAMFPSEFAAYVTPGVIYLIAGILWVALAQDKPEDAPEMPAQSMVKYLGKAAKVGYVWLAGLCTLLFWAGFMAYNGNLANALNVVKGIDPVTAGWMASMIFLGNAFGNLLAPIWADKIGRMKPFMAPTAIIGGILLIYTFSASTAILWPLLFIVGFILGGSLPFFMIYPVALPQVGVEAAGSAGGIVATMMLFGAFFVPTFLVAPICGTNFSNIFIFGGVLFIALGIAAFFLPEMGAKGTYTAKYLEKQRQNTPAAK